MRKMDIMISFDGEVRAQRAWRTCFRESSVFRSPFVENKRCKYVIHSFEMDELV